MAVLEAVMAICGILCIIVSFMIPEEQENETAAVQVPASLSEKQKEEIRRQVNELVSEELNAINERTEASLDKISNTKILEMNDYADTVMGEINKSHNEAVFLYDMLNEKAKEVKNTVKDVNIAKHEVKKLQGDIYSDTQNTASGILKSNMEGNVRDIAKERLTELVKQSDERAKNSEAGSKSENQAHKLKAIVNGDCEEMAEPDNLEDGSPESIMYLYKHGMTVRDIAKKLEIGVGEVSLIIGLHEKEGHNSHSK